MRQKTWTLDQLKEALPKSHSMRQLLDNLGLAPAGGNYVTMQNAIKAYGLDASHFKGKNWNKGKVFGPKRNLDVYLDNTFPIGSHRLRQRLIKEGVKEAQCEKCGLSEWLGKPIALELDHINGDHLDNGLDNLAILCPNCHATTPTYRGKNQRKKLND